MTAVAMIFEMTRDYDIVLPMIIAVAFSLGTRRLLSPESIYTLKLARRGQLIPSALHANMFLVQSARQVMETHVLVLGADVPFRDLLGSPDDPAFRHVVVTRNGKIHGVLRHQYRTSARREPGRPFGDAWTACTAQLHRRRRIRCRIRCHQPVAATPRNDGRRDLR